MEKKSWGIRQGSIIRERRKDLGLSMIDVQVRSGISQPQQSVIERGGQNPLDMKRERFFAYMEALRWRPSDFAQAVGLELPRGYDDVGGDAHPGCQRLPYFGSASQCRAALDLNRPAGEVTIGGIPSELEGLPIKAVTLDNKTYFAEGLVVPVAPGSLVGFAKPDKSTNPLAPALVWLERARVMAVMGLGQVDAPDVLLRPYATGEDRPRPIIPDNRERYQVLGVIVHAQFSPLWMVQEVQ